MTAHCGCAIENALKKTEGVTYARVNFADKNEIVKYAEYVSQIASHSNCETALSKLKSLTKV